MKKRFSQRRKERKDFSFPRSAWECRMDAPRPAFPSAGGRFHAERGSEKKFFSFALSAFFARNSSYEFTDRKISDTDISRTISHFCFHYISMAFTSAFKSY
jgi:hypothetical protein